MGPRVLLQGLDGTIFVRLLIQSQVYGKCPTDDSCWKEMRKEMLEGIWGHKGKGDKRERGRRERGRRRGRREIRAPNQSPNTSKAQQWWWWGGPLSSTP